MKTEDNFKPCNFPLPKDPVVIEGMDGSVYAGDTLLTVLEAMRATSWGEPAKDLDGYMRQVAARVYSWNKIVVRHDTPENFVQDLATAAVITVHRNATAHKRHGARVEQED